MGQAVTGAVGPFESQVHASGQLALPEAAPGLTTVVGGPWGLPAGCIHWDFEAGFWTGV